MKRSNEGKVLTLEAAIRQYVKPGMRLHLAGGLGGPSAAICEITRQYSGSLPDFELIQSTITGHAVNLVHCKLVKKLVFSAGMEIAASAGPSRVIQRAHAARRMELENWSLLSLQQRLMGGAMGVGCTPTRSIKGSTLAVDNKDAFVEIDDPFEPGNKIGLVSSINPDISIVHGCVADAYGNTILAAPCGDDMWGSLASRGGVVVTVEEIVSSDVIRKYASLVRIPSWVVKAVCPAPLGAHPFSFANPTIDSFTPYEADIDFLGELHEASADPETLDSWINTWVIGCPTHDHYLKQLGSQRISSLKRLNLRVRPDPKSRSGPPSAQGGEAGFSRDEMIAVAAAREIVDSVRESQHRIMLVGAGSRTLAAKLAYHMLIGQGYEVELITGNGQIGYSPVPGLQTIDTVYSSKMLTDTVTTQGVFVCGKNSRCLSVLGAGQIDMHGNINSSRTSKGNFLVGTGGANDAALAKEVILILDQSKKRFVETLPYISARGENVRRVISNMGVFKKASAQGELHLEACFPSARGASLEETVAEIAEGCGWPLKISGKVRMLSEPSEEELRLLRSILEQNPYGNEDNGVEGPCRPEIGNVLISK